MAERIGTRVVQITTSGSCFIGIPKDAARELKIKEGTVLEVLREGDTVLYRNTGKKAKKARRGKE